MEEKLSIGRTSALSCGILLIVIVLVVGFVYLPALNYPFHYDDSRAIMNNPGLRVEGFGWSSATESLALSPAGMERRPVGQLSFLLNYRLAGLDPAGWRIVNFVIHLLNVILVFFIGLKLLPLLEVERNIAMAGSLVGAALWGLHPIHTQAVTYIVQRLASMMALFYLGSYLFFLIALRRKRYRWLWAAGSLFLFFLALGTKENAVTLPAVMLLTAWYVTPHQPGAATGRILTGFFALTLMGLAGAAVVVGSLPMAELFSGKDFTVNDLILTQPRVIWLYLSLLLFPLPGRLSIDRDFTLSEGLLSPPSTFFAGLGLLILLIFLGRGVWRRSLPWMGVAWFLITLSVENSILPLDLVYEHRLYLPSTVPFLLLGGYMMTLYKRTLRPSRDPL